jgi:hypothetical protein
MTQVMREETGPDTHARKEPEPQPAPAEVDDNGRSPSASTDLTRIRYGAWLIVAAFLMLGIVFGVAIWRYPNASDVAAVVGTLATVTGTILGAFFGAAAGSAGKEAAEAGRRKAERTAQMALGKLPPTDAEEIVRSS